MSRWVDQYFDRDETLPATGQYELVYIVNDQLTKRLGEGDARQVTGMLWGMIRGGLATGYTHEELSQTYRIRRLDSGS